MIDHHVTAEELQLFLNLRARVLYAIAHYYRTLYPAPTEGTMSVTFPSTMGGYWELGLECQLLSPNRKQYKWRDESFTGALAKAAVDIQRDILAGGMEVPEVVQ